MFLVFSFQYVKEQYQFEDGLIKQLNHQTEM
jgi:hypothetical protein